MQITIYITNLLYRLKIVFQEVKFERMVNPNVPFCTFASDLPTSVLNKINNNILIKLIKRTRLRRVYMETLSPVPSAGGCLPAPLGGGSHKSVFLPSIPWSFRTIPCGKYILLNIYSHLTVLQYLKIDI